MLTGKILVTEYTQDEATGDYTVKLTDGTTVTIYSGEVDMSKMPLFSVNASGHWAYTLNGKTEEVLVNGKCKYCGVSKKTALGNENRKTELETHAYEKYGRYALANRVFCPQDLQAIALQFHAKKRLFCKQGLKM